MKRFVLFALLSACAADPHGYVIVTVTDPGGAPSSHLDVSVQQMGQSGVVSITPAQQPIVFPFDFSLSFDSTRSGPLTVQINATSNGVVIASGGGDGQINPGHTTSMTVTLLSSTSQTDMTPDLTGSDLASLSPMDAFDLASADSTVVSIDLAGADLATFPDLAMPDLTMTAIKGDLASSDLAMSAPPDLAVPDLAMPDLAMPDLAMPDLAMPDLFHADLAPPACGHAAKMIFPAGTAVTSALYGVTLALADFNGDHILDLATSVDPGGAALEIVPGAGNGTFKAPLAAVPAGAFLEFAAAADFDGDGLTDALVQDSPAHIRFFKNRGGGVLAPPVAFNAYVPSWMVVADIDGDGALDALTTSESNNKLDLILNDGSGAFHEAGQIPMGTWPRGIATGDLDNVNGIDIVVANRNDGTLSILLNQGLMDGKSFTVSSVTYSSGHAPEALAMADLDGDKIPDLAIAEWAGSGIFLLHGKGDGTFTTLGQTSLAATLGTPRTIIIADLDCDGLPDVIAAGANEVDILHNAGGGSFTGPTTLNLQGNETTTSMLASGDLNGDGWPDIAVSYQFDGNGAGGVQVFLNKSR